MNAYFLRTGLDCAAGVTGFGVNWLIQSSLLLGGGLVIGWLLRRRGPAAQSVIYRATLVAVLVCPMATWALSQMGMPGWSVNLPVPWTRGEPVLAAAAEPQSARAMAAEKAAGVRPSDIGEANTSLSNEFPATAYAASREGPAESMQVPASSVPGPRLQTEGPPAPASPEGQLAASRLVIQRFGVVASLLCLVWFAGTVVLLARISWAWRQLARLRESAKQAASETLGTCREVASLMEVTPPDVKHTPYLPCPCLAGIRRPVVLLPDAPMSMHLRDVLVHELAHLQRRDCHWNLLRRLATAVFFFQPLLWKLSQCMDASSEEVCDDYVVHHGGDRREYAHRLVDMAQFSSTPIAAAGVGMVMLRSFLGKRVLRILDTSRSLSTRVGMTLLAIVIAGGLLGTTVVGLVGIRPESAAAEPVTVATEDGPLESGNKQKGAEDKARDDEDLITVRGRVVDPVGESSSQCRRVRRPMVLELGRQEATRKNQERQQRPIRNQLPQVGLLRVRTLSTVAGSGNRGLRGRIWPGLDILRRHSDGR